MPYPKELTRTRRVKTWSRNGRPVQSRLLVGDTFKAKAPTRRTANRKHAKVTFVQSVAAIKDKQVKIKQEEERELKKGYKPRVVKGKQLKKVSPEFSRTIDNLPSEKKEYHFDIDFEKQLTEQERIKFESGTESYVLAGSDWEMAGHSHPKSDDPSQNFVNSVFSPSDVANYTRWDERKRKKKKFLLISSQRQLKELTVSDPKQYKRFKKENLKDREKIVNSITVDSYKETESELTRNKKYMAIYKKTTQKEKPTKEEYKWGRNLMYSTFQRNYNKRLEKQTGMRIVNVPKDREGRYTFKMRKKNIV